MKAGDQGISKEKGILASARKKFQGSDHSPLPQKFNRNRKSGSESVNGPIFRISLLGIEETVV